MEDEDIAPNMYRYIHIYSWSSQYGQKKLWLYTILEYSVLAWFSAHSNWISCMYVFGAISFSSILRPHLYTAYASMRVTYLDKQNEAKSSPEEGVRHPDLLGICGGQVFDFIWRKQSEIRERNWSNVLNFGKIFKHLYGEILTRSESESYIM